MSTPHPPVLTEVLYFVPDRMEAARWYADLFEAEIIFLDEPDYFFVGVGRQEIWFHLEDEKCRSGSEGVVAYWQVDDLERLLRHALSLGGRLYRGPLRRLDGRFMCQLRDPFGNLVGIIGAADSELENLS